jgi:hypothetical protein
MMSHKIPNSVAISYPTDCALSGLKPCDCGCKAAKEGFDSGCQRRCESFTVNSTSKKILIVLAFFLTVISAVMAIDTFRTMRLARAMLKSARPVPQTQAT